MTNYLFTDDEYTTFTAVANTTEEAWKILNEFCEEHGYDPEEYRLIRPRPTN